MAEEAKASSLYQKNFLMVHSIQMLNMKLELLVVVRTMATFFATAKATPGTILL